MVDTNFLALLNPINYYAVAMAESQVAEVKNRTDIIALVSGYVSLKKAGRNYKGLCPFHGEKTPSFMVSPDRQIFKCFGCSEGGDVFAFYQKIEGVEFGEALKALADKAGVRLKEYQPGPREKQREVTNRINTLAADFYHYLLTQHSSGKKALEYLHGRGINDKSIKEWLLGYAPDNWDSAFKFLSKKKFSNSEIIASGIALPSPRGGAYDRFRKRVIFPIRNVSGVVVGFSGRILGDGEPKYLNSPDNMVFNKSENLYGLDLAKTEIKKENKAVLVEGNLDVISFHQVGVKNVVAPLGTALTERQIELIRRFSDILVIDFDQDSAGWSAVLRGADMAEKAGLAVMVVVGDAKDPDELRRRDPNLLKKSVQPGFDPLKDVINNAVPLYEFLINSALRRYGNTENSINRITREIVPFLARIGNKIVRSRYERMLAQKLGVGEEAVSLEVKKVTRKTVDEESVKEEKPSEKVSLEKYLLALIVQGKFVPDSLETKDIEEDKVRYLLELITKQKDKFSQEGFDEKIPPELLETFNEAALLELPEEIVKNNEKIEAEAHSCVRRIKELNLRAKLKRLSLSIKQAEINRKVSEIDDLTKTFKVLSQELSDIEKIREG